MNIASDTASREMLDKEQVHQNQKSYEFFRRFRDIVISTLALIFLSPLMLAIVIAIRLESPQGKAIFSQTRCGKDGKEFTFYKFRSMCVDAEEKLDALMPMNEMNGPAFKIKNDPRITRVGKIIRKSGLDELPQFWNVLKGDMSIVGPRPPLPAEVEQYDEYYMQRLYITPGITCIWQTQPQRNDMNFDEWMLCDLQYIKQRGLITDCKIMLRTIRVMFGCSGI